MMYTSLIMSLVFALNPPNRTALLLSMEVREKSAHGGGLSPVVAGEVHTPAVWEVLTCHSRMRNEEQQYTILISYRECYTCCSEYNVHVCTWSNQVGQSKLGNGRQLFQVSYLSSAQWMHAQAALAPLVKYPKVSPSDCDFIIHPPQIAEVHPRENPHLKSLKPKANSVGKSWGNVYPNNK